MRGGSSEEAEATDVEVLAQNWDTVMVFMQCQAQWISGMHAPVYAGITAQELESAIRLQRIPVDDQPDLIADIRVMVEATKQVHNQSQPK